VIFLNGFYKDYAAKKTDHHHVLSQIKSNDVIVCGMAATEPQQLLTDLHTIADRVKNVEVYTCLNMKGYEFYMKKEYEDSFINNSWFHNAAIRSAIKSGLRTAAYVPNNLHEAGTNLLALQDPDFYVGIASEMDEHGFFTCSLSATYEKDVIEKAKKVVLEVNKNAPRTHGDTQIHISQVDWLYEVDYPIPELPDVQASETDEKIAGYIAELVHDGSTLQIGIGGIPNAVAGLLKDKRDLGIHTEMFTESMIDLFKLGVITNRKKTLWPGKAICTFALGSKKMYDFIQDNPGVWLLRGSYVNDPYVIAQNDNIVSVNTAIMVDLTGQVCSESIGTTQFSGTGGQLDTHRGAVMSKGGKGVIALSARTRKGASKIVPMLKAGSGVTVPRQDLDWVVTDFGIAKLRGLPVNKRAKELIRIAHPDDRDDLKKQAHDIGLL
jgi:acyl-CoA hydrolase